MITRHTPFYRKEVRACTILSARMRHAAQRERLRATRCRGATSVRGDAPKEAISKMLSADDTRASACKRARQCYLRKEQRATREMSAAAAMRRAIAA